MAVPILSLNSRISLVTGSRRGIGRMIALRFAEAGADVAVCATTTDERLNSVAKEIEQFGRRSLAASVDIREQASICDLVENVERNIGHIDILVNVAGALNISPLVDLPEKDWDKVLDTNLKGTYLMCQAVARGMIERKRGCIINISSTDAFNPVPYQVAYNCSKAGVNMLTSVLAFELGQYNIRVNAIAPGFVWTEMTEYLKSDPAALKDTEEQIVMGRLGEPIEIANVALFLASDLASFVTGATWRVDGGTNPPSLSCVPATI